MQHAVEVERLLEGRVRNHDVKGQGDNHGDEVELIGVDRTLDHIHLPDDIGIERLGNGFEEVADRFDPATLFEQGIDEVRPVALNGDTAERKYHTGKQRRPGTGGGSETAVKTEDHDRSAAAHPHHGDDGHEQVDVVQLRHEKTAEEEDHTDADGDQTDRQNMLFRSEGGLAQRHDYVLSNGERSTVDTGVVSGDHREHQQQAEQTDESVGQDLAHTGCHHLLIVQRTELLETGIRIFFHIGVDHRLCFLFGHAGIGFHDLGDACLLCFGSDVIALKQCLVDNIEIGGVKVFLFTKRGIFADFVDLRFDS